MKIFCYFIEPASYTLDIARNIHDKKRINYCFVRSTTLASSDSRSKKTFLDKLSFFKKIMFIFSQFRKNNFIIINGYNNYPFVITFLLNFFFSNKIFIAIDSDTQLSFPKNLLKRFVKWLYLSVIFRSEYVLGFAGGNYSHKDLFRYYGMTEDRIFLMPMMVDNSKFHQEDKLFPNRFTFLYVGRLVKHKNVEKLIQEFNKNFQRKDAVLKIIGSGDEEYYLSNKYSSDKVLFLGKLFNNDLTYEFKNASCFVCPSDFEPWGLVINEALSSGLPVITTSVVGANNDLVKDKDTGMIALDMNEFGDRMLELYDDFDLLMRFSKNASDLMKNSWNYGLYEKGLDESIDKVVKELGYLDKY